METLYWIIGILIVAGAVWFLYQFFRAKHEEDVNLDFPPPPAKTFSDPDDEADYYERKLKDSNASTAPLTPVADWEQKPKPVSTGTAFTPKRYPDRRNDADDSGPSTATVVSATSVPLVMTPLLIDSDPTPSYTPSTPTGDSPSRSESSTPSPASSYNTSGSTFSDSGSSFSGSGGSTFSGSSSYDSGSSSSSYSSSDSSSSSSSCSSSD